MPSTDQDRVIALGGLFQATQCVRDIARDPVNRAIVASISEIGHSAKKSIIAEFVENDGILGHLREIGVDYAQGYAIDVPGRFPGSPDSSIPQLMSA